MSIQNLIIYKFIPLYDILEELSLNLNFKVSLIEDENSLNKKKIYFIEHQEWLKKFFLKQIRN